MGGGCFYSSPPLVVQRTKSKQHCCVSLLHTLQDTCVRVRELVHGSVMSIASTFNGYPYLHDASANKNVHVSNASRHRRCWLLLLLLLFCFFELCSRQRGQLRQLRAPSMLDSSGLVPLPPAPRQVGRDCSALCVLFSYSLLCALLRGR